jgi:hypothetical protein
MRRAYIDAETALLRRMTAEQKLRALDAIRRSAELATEVGVRLRQSGSGRDGHGGPAAVVREQRPLRIRRGVGTHGKLNTTSA